METLVEEVDVGPFRILLERPTAPESLLDEKEFARDEFMPYWAEVWPSGVALARRLATRDLSGVTVLELGCGLGLPSLAAALRGGAVVATDWARDALDLLGHNAERNEVEVEPLHFDWRAHAPFGTRRFDLFVAADVLYEERNAEPLLALLPRVVTDSGEAIVADPGRRYAHLLLAGAVAAGWTVETVCEQLLPRGGIHHLRRA